MATGRFLRYNSRMQLQTIADITPNGTKVQLSSNTALKATWIEMTATGTSIRFGDTNVGASRGVLLTNGATVQVAIRGDFAQQGYSLSECYVYGASGSDKVSITYGV